MNPKWIGVVFLFYAADLTALIDGRVGPASCLIGVCIGLGILFCITERSEQ